MTALSSALPVLLFGDQWDGRWRRRQQFAARLSTLDDVQGVLYVESPLTLTSRMKAWLGLADPDAQERWRRARHARSLFELRNGRLSVCTPRTLFRLTGISALDALHRRAASRLVARSCREVWSSEPASLRPLTIVTHPWWPLSFYESLGLQIDCYDCTDDFSSFHDLPERVRRMVRTHDDQLTTSAGAVTCVSEWLTERKLDLNPNTHLVPNGVDLDLFAAPTRPLGLRDKCAIPSDATLLAYVGGVNKRVDTDLLRQTLASRPNWHVVIAGVNSDPSLCGAERIHLRGELPLEQVPAFLAEADVCIVPHKVDDLTRSMDPQKVYDYLASGKPIAATPVAGTEQFRGLIEIAQDRSDFPAAVERALREGTGPRQARFSAAASAGWNSRVELFWNILAHSRERAKAA